MAMRLILLSTPAIEDKEEHDLLCFFFENGLRHFHLRKPGATHLQLKNFIRAIPISFQPFVVIHDHYPLSLEFNLRGIHLPEKEKQKHLLNKDEFNEYKIISTSRHSIEDLESWEYPYEYVFISPVFDSLSKENYKAAFEFNALQKAVEEYKRYPTFPKLIALGGVAAARWNELKNMSFDGAAVLGAVWNNSDPRKAFTELMQLSNRP